MRCTRQISSGCVAELVSGLANSDIIRKEKHILVGRLKQFPAAEVQSHCQQLLCSNASLETLVSAFEYLLQGNFGLPDTFCHKLLDKTVIDISHSPIGSVRLLRSCQTALKLLRSLGLEAVPAKVAEKLRSVLIERLVDLQQSGGSDCLCLAYLLLVALCRSDLPSLTLQSLTGQPTDRAAASSQLAFWNALLTQDAYLSRRGSVTPNDDEVRDSSCSIDVHRLLDCLLYALQLNSVAADPLLLSRTILLCYEALLARCQSTDGESYDSRLAQPQLTQLTLDYVMANMESHIFLVKHNCSAIFNCLVRLIDRISGCWDAVLRRVHSLSWEAKAKYALLQGLAAAQPRLVLTACPNVLRVAVRQSREHVLGYYASDLFLALVPHCESPSTWLDALVKGVDNASDGHLLSIRDHFLQKLVRLKQPEFLSALCQAQYRKQRHRASRVKLLILSAGLKRVRLGEKECGILASLLRPACFWLHSRISFDAFNIWLSTQQSGAASNTDDSSPSVARQLLSNQFNFCSEFFTAWLGCPRSEERQRLAATFHAFLKRSLAWVKSGVFNSAEEAAAFYTDRLIQLCRTLLSQLHPGCSFPRRSSILELCLAALRCGMRSDVCTADFDPRQLLGNFSGAVAAQIADTFDANRANAVQLLSLIMQPTQTDLAAALASSAVSMHRSWRPQDAPTAHHLFVVLTEPAAPRQCRLALAKALGKSGVAADAFVDDGSKTQLVEWLTDQLEQQVTDAETAGLRFAAIRSPMHPTLHCLRRLAPFCKGSLSPLQLAERLLLLAKRATRAVSPVVASSAPEGGIVDGGGGSDSGGFPLGPGLSLESGCFDANEEAAGDPAANLPEFLVVCCWRTVKEASLLVAELSERHIPGDCGAEGSQEFIERMVRTIHAFYKELLFDSRHRGAFELAYEGFGRFCASVWRCPAAPLGCLPAGWLAELLSDLAGPPVDRLRLCLTRRSAGLPYYILGIVASEPARTKASPRPL
ncbi:hypothetical protein BOX15_Mlig004773g6 [Macrostomum lignano]|uniref:DUF2428 domain-containing protein n=1 Tax=Macrostomum lignano TaxID=282301 RepID=A0A267G4T0_9PLAT|nr:hypothetical protein BOX15_Mlig004773g6 [Macrostomum lignano]